MHRLFIAGLLTLLAGTALLVLILLFKVIAANRRATKELACPNCERHAVRLSWQKGWMDYVMSKLACPPYRCIACNHRFYRRKRIRADKNIIQAEEEIRAS
jgi:hypothetical protein